MLRSVVLVALLVGATTAWADSIEDKAALCAACHGAKGLPEDKSIPIVWGQHAGYLYLELRDFQKGARKDDRMTPIAQSVSKEDALALAEYFAAKPWPNTGAPAASKADTEVAIAVNKSIVCTSCHLEQYQGNSSVPRLAGPGARLSPQDHDGLPHARARQQPRHVGSDEFHHARADRRNGGVSGWVLSAMIK